MRLQVHIHVVHARRPDIEVGAHFAMHQPLVLQRVHGDVHLGVVFQEGGRVARPRHRCRRGARHHYVVGLHHLGRRVALHVVLALPHGVVGAQVKGAAHVGVAVGHALLLEVAQPHRHVESRRLLDNYFGHDVAGQSGVVEALGGLLLLFIVEGNA